MQGYPNPSYIAPASRKISELSKILTAEEVEINYFSQKVCMEEGNVLTGFFPRFPLANHLPANQTPR